MSFSVSVSNDDVASSNSKIGGFFKSVRAIPTLCFSPPDNFSPRSPTVVLYPSGKFEIKLWIFGAGIKRMSGIAAENYGVLVLEFEFDWDKDATIANVRDKMSKVEAEFPKGADKYTVTEINFSEFPILVVSLSGELPERTLLHAAKNLKTEVEALPEVLEVGLAGHRNEMLEVIIDPLRLESYNVTAGELINVVTNNNQLIAAGTVETDTGAFSVKIPSSFDKAQDVYNLPVNVNGDSIVTLGGSDQLQHPRQMLDHLRSLRKPDRQ